MLLLKRYEEPLFDPRDSYEQLYYRYLPVKRGVELVLDTPPSHYREHVLETLTGKSTDKCGVGQLTSVFIHPVDYKYLWNHPQILLHNVYFRHINPLYSGVVDSYVFPKELSNAEHQALITEVRKVVRSIKKPILNVINEDLFIWLNKTLFNYSSRLLKVDFLITTTKITVELRYVNPGETNPDIGILCRRDGRLKECYQDIVNADELIALNKVYFRCGGYLNVRQIMKNMRYLSNNSLLTRISEMKNTGYPSYATLQNGVAVLGNIFTNKLDTTGLSSFESDILKEALEYTPWVRR